MAEEFHKHKPKDIKPQGENSGLDADKVDGKHASELGGGGGGTSEWEDITKLFWLLHPNYYDSVSSATYVTRKSGYWQLYSYQSTTNPTVHAIFIAVGYGYNLFSKNPEFIVAFSVPDLSGAIVRLVLSAGAGETASNHKFGVIIENSTLKIVSSNGTETKTDIGAIATGFHRVRCRLTSGSKIEVWVDDAASPTQKTTNLPSAMISDAEFCARYSGVVDWAMIVYPCRIKGDK
jgi:hypothetical protein